MKHEGNRVSELKIAYIGGGSRGWAWGLMSDLAAAEDICGDVYLYDIDTYAAKCNEIIGNKYNDAEGAKSVWNYHTAETIDEALSGADFVVISIQPATYDEMESDVHHPEKYGIWQPVGDSTGPGGIVRAMRTIPMYEYFAEKIRENCPKAWVINYTNPMTLCVRTLYRVFPQIKAFGCCHEVFGTQKFLCKMVQEELGVEEVTRQEILVNPIGVNHFTWLTEATYRGIDLFPHYKNFCKRHENGYDNGTQRVDANWVNDGSQSQEMVKMDLFNRYGVIAAAGDRHLSEFCPGKWYLESPERVEEMKFGLTLVSARKEIMKNHRMVKSEKLVSGEQEVKLWPTGEEGVEQIRALLGLRELITNVNIPNKGQIPNLPMDAVVETNAVFRDNSLMPVQAGNIPDSIFGLVSRICAEQELVNEGAAERNLTKLFNAFVADPLVTCSYDDAKKMFKEMCENTKEYLTMYDLSQL